MNDNNYEKKDENCTITSNHRDNNNVANSANQQSEDSEVSSEEGEDLILEGVLMRNPEILSSASSVEEEAGNSDDDDCKNKSVWNSRCNSDTEKKKKKMGSLKHSVSTNLSLKSKISDKTAASKVISSTSSSSSSSIKRREPEIIPIEFTFNDMNEKFFHGLLNHIITQPIFGPYASDITSIIIENISVGTVVSSQDGENNVFGVASVLNVTTYNEKTCIQYLKKILINQCPDRHKNEMKIVLSGKTKRPAGFYIHGRMINLPLEITFVLHEQLVLDMDWAVKNAEDGEEERKSLNFGAFIALAPCSIDTASHSTVYKNFDDEIFANFAEFVYTIDLNKEKKRKREELQIGVCNSNGSNGMRNDDQKLVNVIVLTKTGHRDAMKELKKLIHGAER